MPTDENTDGAPKLSVKWRVKAGTVLFPLALVPYGLLAPVFFHKLPLKTIATLATAGVILQKVLFVSAAMLLGKTGFALLKAKLFRKLTPPTEVGPMRYRIGLVMLCVPFLGHLLEPYASRVAPRVMTNRLWVDVTMDAILIASVFVLGGNFWDKLRALFVPEARAVFPEDLKTTAFPPSQLDHNAHGIAPKSH